MSRRVVLGRYLNGTMGLKVSRPGFDALTDDDSDPNKFSFNSQWSNIVPVHQVGIVGPYPYTVETTGSVEPPWVDVGHNLAFIPYIEARAFYPQNSFTSAGDVVYDDYRTLWSENIQVQVGAKGQAYPNRISLKVQAYFLYGPKLADPITYHYHQVLYVIYRQPVTV